MTGLAPWWRACLGVTVLEGLAWSATSPAGACPAQSVPGCGDGYAGAHTVLAVMFLPLLAVTVYACALAMVAAWTRAALTRAVRKPRPLPPGWYWTENDEARPPPDDDPAWRP